MTVFRCLLAAVALVLFAAACGGAGSLGSTPPQGTEIGPTTSADPGSADLGDGDDDLGVSTAGWSTDFSRHNVPLSEFASGGPAKDGIPAIDEPAFDTVTAADKWLEDREPVIELEIEGDVRAYPLQVLIWHEIANDTVGGVPVTVTFCPLCNTALVFDRRLDGQVLDFGTTGNLRNSDLVMYDRQTESWWQQFSGEAVVGELVGGRLRHLPARIVAWEDFARRHPDGQVLSRETGQDRPYGQNPYTGYDSIDSPPFFDTANSDDDRLAPKERVVYLERGGDAVAIAFTHLQKMREITVEVGGERLRVVWRPGVRSALDEDSIATSREVGSAEVRTRNGELTAFDTPFWFAVAAFRPDVRVVG